MNWNLTKGFYCILQVYYFKNTSGNGIDRGCIDKNLQPSNWKNIAVLIA